METAPRKKGNTLKEKECFLFRSTSGQEKETGEKETKHNMFPFRAPAADAETLPAWWDDAALEALIAGGARIVATPESARALAALLAEEGAPLDQVKRAAGDPELPLFEETR